MSQISEKRLSRSRVFTGNVSRTIDATRRFLGSQVWAWPLIAGLILCLVGWTTARAIEKAIGDQVGEQIGSIREAVVKGLRLWMKQQEATAVTLASSDRLIQEVKTLLELDSAGRATQAELLNAPAQAAIRAYLAPRLKDHGYQDFMLVTPKLRVIGSKGDGIVGSTFTGYREEFARIVMAGRPMVSHPYRAVVLLPDEKGELKAGLPTMLVAAPIYNDQHEGIALLMLRIRPEGEFTEILEVARYGKSGESYAFNKDGLFLSNSRFDDLLKRIGLVADLPDARSILTVEARDPGVDMTVGYRPELRRSEQPLTRAAAGAISGQDGIDVSGYRGYRGANRVGAWTWLPEYNFGLIVEADYAEAFRPIRILRISFWSLIGLLFASAVAIYVYMLRFARQRLALQHAVLTAKQLGQYQLEKKIGAGGMGTVYKAKHAMLRRPTAVKLLEPSKTSPAAIGRFEREVQLTSQLNHPNTIAIFDYGKTPEGVFYYAMEFLDGLNLEDLVIKYGPQPEGRVVFILTQVCGSLFEAHGAGLIHRDIKPANILLNHRGGMPDVVKVLDFGLARAAGAEQEANITAAGSVVGTPLYLSPESIERPETVDGRADLYAVGAVGYFLLTGTPPFTGETLAQICLHHLRTPPEPPEQRLGRPVTRALSALLIRCLAKQPHDRPADARSLLVELANCGVGQWSQTDAEAWWQRHRNQAPAETSVDTSPASTQHANVTAEFVEK